MNKLLHDYEIYPKFILEGKETKVTIRPLGAHVKFNPEVEFEALILPMNETMEPFEGDQDENYNWVNPKYEDGNLVFSHTFTGEQQYWVRLFDVRDNKQRRKSYGTFPVYSCFADLYERRPYKGDLHVHSNQSDGHEDPAIVLANYRKHGYDFTGLTDHGRHYPSIMGIEAYNSVPVDMLLCKGEEVHLPDNHVHIVNFGGNVCINDMAKSNEEKYRAEVNEIAAKLDLPEGINKFEYASCIWAFDRIRETGGIGIFAHPHWKSNAYHVKDAFSKLLFENKPFDAFELLGGHEYECNNMQTTFYYDARANGQQIPIVGSSDSHGSIKGEGWFDMFKTIVFAKELSTEGIKEAITNLYSVAVECYDDKFPRVYGPYRFVSFAIFCLENYFPLHDEICFEEGRQMKAYIVGDEKAEDMLKLMHGRVSKYLEKMYS